MATPIIFRTPWQEKTARLLVETMRGRLSWSNTRPKPLAYYWPLAYYLSRPGYDPRNYHGRHMRLAGPCRFVTRYTYIIVDDFVPGCDPRNHTGSAL